MAPPSTTDGAKSAGQEGIEIGWPKKICVVTGSRAEYGILRPLLSLLNTAADFSLQLVVTGAHLSSRHGMTVNEIEADGYAIAKAVPVVGSGDSRLEIARAMGAGVAGLAEAFAELVPDLVMVLGDRYEILAAAQAALLLSIPLAHLYGGEVTEGAWDEAIRHAITKMANLHFAAADAYADRIIQMGEDPAKVHAVGTLAVDTALALPRADKARLSAELGVPLWDPCLVVTYHPVTCHKGDESMAVAALLDALDAVAGARIIITGANADAGGGAVMATLAAYADARADRVTLHASLGQTRYLSVLQHAAAVVGNSSSALVEAPALGVPTVNIGDRQRGRLRAASVIDCGETCDEIAQALARALDPSFRAACQGQDLPYKGGKVAEKILSVLRDEDFAALGAKPFFDLPVRKPC